ncbi:YitT family protein [Chakrabartyella piscis]|uniref:YitT family protein n=1 Tax=Chakrabartyella piscis TaxID=2918914 RepID=UPI0029583A1E|nr:YitT family protein [Chakrabartyella piscis]
MTKGIEGKWFLGILGVSLMAVGIQCFLEPANLVAGGVTGLGMICNRFTEMYWGKSTPLWFVNIAANLPLFCVAYKQQGGRYLGKTIAASFLFSLVLFLVEDFSFDSLDLMLSALYGGALVGIGLGFVFQGGATTGGVDLLASLIEEKLPRYSVSQLIFVMDATIILLGMLVFGGTIGLYAIVSVFVSERCMRWMMEGVGGGSGLIVISTKSHMLKESLSCITRAEFVEYGAKDRVMELQANVLFCVISRKELPVYRKIVDGIDGNARMYLVDVRKF